MGPESSDEPWVTIGIIVGPRGNKGEVKVSSLTKGVDRYRQFEEVFLCKPESPAQAIPAKIESAWEHKGWVVVKFKHVNSIGDAEKLSGWEIRIPASQRAPLEEGEYYESDLVGCLVRDARSGEVIGRVRGWEHYGGPPLLEVEGSDGSEILVPFARAICLRIEPEKKEILVELPEGLLELNRE